MRASTVGAGELENSYVRAERLCQEAAEVERVAYLRWQDAFAAYQIAREEATDAWTACMRGRAASSRLTPGGQR